MVNVMVNGDYMVIFIVVNLSIVTHYINLPSVKHNYGESPFWTGKSTMFMAVFSSYVKLPVVNSG